MWRDFLKLTRQINRSAFVKRVNDAGHIPSPAIAQRAYFGLCLVPYVNLSFVQAAMLYQPPLECNKKLAVGGYGKENVGDIVSRARGVKTAVTIHVSANEMMRQVRRKGGESQRKSLIRSNALTRQRFSKAGGFNVELGERLIRIFVILNRVVASYVFSESSEMCFVSRREDEGKRIAGHVTVSGDEAEPIGFALCINHIKERLINFVKSLALTVVANDNAALPQPVQNCNQRNTKRTANGLSRFARKVAPNGRVNFRLCQSFHTVQYNAALNFTQDKSRGTVCQVWKHYSLRVGTLLARINAGVSAPVPCEVFR